MSFLQTSFHVSLRGSNDGETPENAGSVHQNLQSLPKNHSATVARAVSEASLYAIRSFCASPRFVNRIHIPFLQASQQIVELQEASQIAHALASNNINTHGSMQDVKGIVKTWKSRLPLEDDDLSFWSDLQMRV